MNSIKEKFNGVIVPMITPITASGSIDEKAVIKIIERFIGANVCPFILGTTGEGPSVPKNQKEKFVEIVCSEFKESSTIYAGISSNVFEESVYLGNIYARKGVHAVVANLPSYYSLNKEQMYEYFKNLADNLKAPLIIYNITSTTNMSIPLEIVEKLSLHHNIIGLKDSERDEERLHKAIVMYRDNSDFVHHIGWAAKSVNGLIMGSDGLVPSTANFVPGIFRELYDYSKRGEFEKAMKLQRESDEIAKIYQSSKGLAHSLASLKVMINQLGLCETHMFPPLTNIDKHEEMEIRNKIKEIEIPIR